MSTMQVGESGALLNTTVLLDEANRRIFHGRMDSSQRNGILRIVRAWHKYGNKLDTALSYVLATSHKETGARMQPVLETFADTRAQGARRLQRAFDKGQLRWVRTPYWGLEQGHHWIGAGDVQLTHRDNYRGPIRQAVLKEFDKDILTDPDLVLDPEISAFIMIEGMLTRATLRGDFTGKALEEYVNESATDYHNARRAVNPGDRSSYAEIAGTAGDFETAISKARAAAGHRFYGPESDIYNGRYDKRVENVQQNLRKLGYTEVGSADGRWGTRTAGAVLAFRNDNGLALVPKIDAELLGALVEAEDRLVAPARAKATVADLREAGSTTIARNDSLTKVGGGVAGTAAVAEVADKTGILDKISENGVVVDQALGWVDRASGLVAENSTLVFAGIGLAIVYYCWKSNKARRDDHRDGTHLSR